MIETPLAMLPLDSDVQEICDWLELYALSSEFHVAMFSELSRMWDKRRNTEKLDFQASSSSEDDEFLEKIYQTARERMDCLGDCYPFIFSDNDEELVFNKHTLNEGSVIYIFCLFISNANNRAIFDDDSFFSINNQVRDLFQACSTWAAAGEVQGHSYSFGFPRPDHSSFLPKLTAVYQKFSDGKVRNEPIPGVSINPKDEEIDIIAWRPRQDNAPGTYYILGQVASGNNWPDKSITGAIDAFHANWFEIPPASRSIPAMFIPFNIVPTNKETLQDRISVLTRRFGSLFYRYRIPLLAKAGLEIGRCNNNLVIERLDDIDVISAWVNDVIEKFRDACVYA
ncbi:hypothetical protein [Methylomonas fluvii]|uniref:Uncharacterized protein n=1 Tax=Methylomonas fluvii TaxID=1854564 RepID=A0ABR9D8K8_9GAMM|nr:hypothetical protein [Methylomonas fluvii]MBD9359442.1 hypothetical protein [Methylomonas fluvii]CAD6872169.1 hypothetical protein [Methylomonas fluvii]